MNTSHAEPYTPTSLADTVDIRRLKREQSGTREMPPLRALPSAPPATAVLVLIGADGRGPGLLGGRRYEVRDAPVVVGRDPACTVHLPSKSVSRTHARVDRGPCGTFRATDLGSSNGTYVNSQRVTTSALNDGDALRVGDVVFRFLAGDGVEARYHEELRRMAAVDPLTGLPSRRAADEALERELSRAARHARPLAALLLGLDRFRDVNDRLGHAAGDETLRDVAARLRRRVRREDTLARYGGDQFAVILPDTGPTEAVMCAERLRLAVAGTPFEYDGTDFGLTASVGIAVTDGTEQLTAADFLSWAGQLLHDAKQAGRDRVLS